MIKQYEKLLDCKNVLRQNLDLLIDVFVSYYGENQRAAIEEKFQKAIWIAYHHPDAKKNFMKKIIQIHTDDLISSLLQEYPSSLTQEDLLLYNSLDNMGPTPFSHFCSFYEQYKAGVEGRKEIFKRDAIKVIQSLIPSFTQEDYEELLMTQQIPTRFDQLRLYEKENLFYYADLSNAEKEYKKSFINCKSLLMKIDSQVSFENVSEVLSTPQGESIIQYAQHLPEIISEFHSRMKKYDQYQKEIEENEKQKNQLLTKYYFQFVEENIDLISPEDQIIINRIKENPRLYYQLPPYVMFLFGYYNINETLPFLAFSEESDQQLMDPDTTDWDKNNIQERRIEYFKRNGMDLGEDYQSYINNEQVRKIWPSKERVKAFAKSRLRLINEFNNEYYTSLPEHIQSRQEIDNQHLLGIDDSFNALLYTDSKSKTKINPSLVLTDTGYDLMTLIIICCDNDDGYIDHNIIHEINHLLEVTLLEIEEEFYSYICGWDIIKEPIHSEKNKTVDTLHTEIIRRPYELFNEIINELITQDIYAKMLEKDQHIFDTKENASLKGSTNYQHTFFLVRDFFKEFKEEILASRRDGNIRIIWDAVGKENFDEMNELFRIFHENFSGMRIYKVLKDKLEERDSKELQIYHDLERRRDIILDKMRKHNMLSESNSKIEIKKEPNVL